MALLVTCLDLFGSNRFIQNLVSRLKWIMENIDVEMQIFILCYIKRNG